MGEGAGEGAALSRALLVAPLALILGACATVPTGPSVMVLPGSSKTFDQFRFDGAGQLPDQRILRVIGVLILVDENVPESPLIQCGDLGEGPEQIDDLPDEIKDWEPVHTLTDRSSDEIREDLQSVSVGDRIPDSLDRSVFFTVEAVERERALVLRSTKHLLRPMRSIDFTWAFILEPIDDRTRFVIRARARYAPRWSWLILGVPYGLGDWLNTTNILHAVKQRAERHAAAAHRLTGDVHAEGRMRSAGRTPGQRPTRRRGAAGVCPGSRSSPPPRPPI